MKNDKLIKEKIRIAAVLLIVYAAFMVQQVMLNPVLCYKADGSVDLEAAYWGFQCECKDENQGSECNDKNHNHTDKNINPSGNGDKDGKCVGAECCYDVPLKTGLLIRESNSIFPGFTLIELHPVHDGEKIHLPNPYTGFPEQIPLNKFINRFPFPSGAVILRC
ncbi:MAG: hypothetical protein KAT34_09570 [Candidatus Aminicenantes bacterium]|nr:hypothetical protein [Candidatus Aminicenantes bacterium]